jgi:NhaA family Na+:H+ antiporter
VRRVWRDALPYYPLLPFGAVMAIVWANTASESYFRVAQALAFPVNDIGVAFGLASLAQEVLEATDPDGSMPSWRYVLLPVIGAVGGTIGAAATYWTFIHFTDEQILTQGWRIACGVDVFFCVALARLIFRRRSSVSVVVLLAVVSDIIALVIVSRQPFVAVADPAAGGLVVLAIAVSYVFYRLGVRSMWPYLLVAGPMAWAGCYGSGLHPALALLPIVPFFPRAPRPLDDLRVDRHAHTRFAHFELVFAYPLQAVAFLFGLANAGVLLRGVDTGTWAVLTASLVGKPAGILVAAAIAGACGLVPARSIRWPDLIVIALIGSVGLGFGLFLSTAVFPVGPLLTETKLGAIATLAGAAVAFAAARVLRVGRFARAAADV